MKRYLILLILLGLSTISLKAQEVDCEGTIRAWQADVSLREYMRTHNCSCPNPKQKPVCKEISIEPEPTTTPRPRPTANPAEEQAKRDAAWNTRKAELLKLLKKADDLELPPTPTPSPTPFKPDPAVYAELRVKTNQRIKELNCSAYFGLEAAKTAINANIEIRKNLDDDLEMARSLAEMSVGVEKGETKALETCPEVQGVVPEIPPPVEQNPQIRLFDSMFKDLQSLIPEIIEAQTAARDFKDWREEVKNDMTRNRKEKAALDPRPKTLKTKAEKQKKEDEFDALLREALAAEAEAKKVDERLNGYREKVSAYQNVYDTVTKEPNRAKEFLPK